MTIVNKKFQNIALFVGVNNTNIIDAYREVKEMLSINNYNLFITDTTWSILKDSSLPIVSNYNDIDIIITIGGDGTMLKATELARANDLPLLGINCGRLGFLTDICATNQKLLLKVLSGEHITEKRPLMTAEMQIGDQTKSLGFFLNDLVLTRGGLPRVVEFDLYINDKFICNQRADGIVIATPTGSTAYSLSAGGPILEPGVDAITIAPICAHTLNTRPIVIKASERVSIVAKHRDEVEPCISCDGKERIGLPQNAIVSVNQSGKSITLVHPCNYNYFETLKEKLHWERKPHARISTD